MTPAQHIATSIHLRDRLAHTPGAYVPNLSARARMHVAIARRPELERVLPAIINHPAAPAFVAAIK